MIETFILSGSNLGDRLANLAEAKQLLSYFVGDIELESGIYETAPWGVADQPNFYNQVLKISTDLIPQDLLLTLQQIEEKMGREEADKGKMLPRVIDLDILYFGADIIASPDLQIPHPQIPNRRFTLIPLVEIAPDFQHPVLQKNHQMLLEECQDILTVVSIAP
jgi:2-amino-4-hydroxy-6-hydroxymethyldihydropteridine diphosphokinase